MAGRSRTVQAAIARLEGVVLPEHLPDRVRDDVLAAIERPGPTPRGGCRSRTSSASWRASWTRWRTHPDAVEAHAQTHRAVLDGAPVRVKVGRPGLAASARSDLSLLDLMAAPAAPPSRRWT